MSASLGHTPGDFTFNTFTKEGQAWVFSSLIFSSTNQRSRLSMAALQPPPLAPNHSNYIYPKNDIISNHRILNLPTRRHPNTNRPAVNLTLQPFCGHEGQLILLRNVSVADIMTKPHWVRHWRGMWREYIAGISTKMHCHCDCPS